MENKPVRDKNNKNPYDLSAIHWVCGRCGGLPQPTSPYAPRKYGAKYCTCNQKKKK